MIGSAAVIWGLERKCDAFGGDLKQNWHFSQLLKVFLLTLHMQRLSTKKVFVELSLDFFRSVN